MIIIFRRHVARGPDSIFRSVADVVFSTQHYRDVVAGSFDRFRNTEAGRKIFDEPNNIVHKEAVALSKIFGLSIEIVSTSDPQMRAVVITPDDVFLAPFLHEAHSDDEDGRLSTHRYYLQIVLAPVCRVKFVNLFW